MFDRELFANDTAWFSEGAPEIYKKLWCDFSGKIGIGMNDSKNNVYFCAEDTDQVTLKYKHHKPLKGDWIIESIKMGEKIDKAEYYYEDEYYGNHGSCFSPQVREMNSSGIADWEKFGYSNTTFKKPQERSFKNRYSEGHLPSTKKATSSAKKVKRASLSSSKIQSNVELWGAEPFGSSQDFNDTFGNYSYQESSVFTNHSRFTPKLVQSDRSQSLLYPDTSFLASNFNGHSYIRMDTRPFMNEGQHQSKTPGTNSLKRGNTFDSYNRPISRMTSKSSRLSKTFQTRKVIRTDDDSRQSILQGVIDFTPNQNGFLVYKLNQ